jgi:NitT/TauT family transport system substrate-binding protein
MRNPAGTRGQSLGGRRCRLVRPLFLLSVTLLLVGCETPQPDPLRLAVNGWPGYQYFALAKQKGFIDSADVDELTIVETASLTDSVRAFERGQVDMIGGTLAELADINSHRTRDARAVAALNRSIGGDMVVARKGLDSLESLKGRRIALELPSANALVLAAAARHADIDIDEMTLVARPQGELARGFERGEIDAAVTYPPFATELLTRPDIHRVFDTSEAPDAVIDVLIVASEVIDRAPDQLQALLMAHDRALQWAQAHPAEARRILADHAGMTPEALRDIEPTIEMLSLAAQKPMWAAGGALETSLDGAVTVLAAIHDEEMETHRPVRRMLDRRILDMISAR